MHFNSTLVRLKVLLVTDILVPLANFNSTLVRLKVWQTQSKWQVVQDFNSTLVRLKGTESGDSSFWRVISIPHWYD